MVEGTVSEGSKNEDSTEQFWVQVIQTQSELRGMSIDLGLRENLGLWPRFGTEQDAAYLDFVSLLLFLQPILVSSIAYLFLKRGSHCIFYHLDDGIFFGKIVPLLL